jgi:hypothetical protein
MRPNRRWFQYSLRSFLVVLTAAAVWLGVVVNRAREQREAVKAIEAAGGEAFFDWEYPDKPIRDAWLRRIVGNQFSEEVEAVFFRPDLPVSTILDSIRYLQQLRPKIVAANVHPTSQKDTKRKLQAALPYCEIRLGYFSLD